MQLKATSMVACYFECMLLYKVIYSQENVGVSEQSACIQISGTSSEIGDTEDDDDILDVSIASDASQGDNREAEPPKKMLKKQYVSYQLFACIGGDLRRLHIDTDLEQW